MTHLDKDKPSYPYVVKDGKYFANPKWIEQNKKKVMMGSNIEDYRIKGRKM